jgi:hypothetical protein
MDFVFLRYYLNILKVVRRRLLISFQTRDYMDRFFLDIINLFDRFHSIPLKLLDLHHLIFINIWLILLNHLFERITSFKFFHFIIKLYLVYFNIKNVTRTIRIKHGRSHVATLSFHEKYHEPPKHKWYESIWKL